MGGVLVRWLRVMAAGGLVAVVALVGVGAGSASAFGSCAPGSVQIPGGACVSILDGSAETAGGTLTGTPPRLTQPSSVLAGANGTGGTVAQNAQAAAANGSAAAAGRVGLSARLGQGLTVLSVGVAAYELTSSLLQVGCDNWGWSAVCTGSPAATFVPNLDVVTGDPGWVVGSGAVAFIRQTYWDCSGQPAGPVSVQLKPVSPVPSVGAVVTASAAAFGFSGSCVINGGDWTAATYAADGTVACAGCLFNSVVNQAATTGYVTWQTSSVPSAVIWAPTAALDAVTGRKMGDAGAYARAKGAAVSSGGSVYLFPGNPARPADADLDPVRTLQTSVQCKAAGGTVTTVSASSAGFRETDREWPAVPAPACPAGTVPLNTDVRSVGGPSTKTIWSVTTPDAVADALLAHPECAGGKCRLTLAKIGPAGADLGDCFEQAGRCEGWFADPDKATNYQCQYGLAGAYAAVALSECNVYAPTFTPSELGRGVGYGDPATGDIPTGAPTPDGQPDPADDPSESNACWPSGWAAVMDPFSWVLTPIKCALVWAFVPSHAQLSEAGDLMGGIGTHLGISQWTDALYGPISALGPLLGGGACAPWVESVPLGDGYTRSATFLDPCEGWGLMLATTSKLIIGAATVVGGAWAAFRAFSSIALKVRLGVADAAEIERS